MRKVYFVEEIRGSVVIDNCGTIRLSSGGLVLWDGIINPEHDGKREFIEWDTDKGIKLPLDFAI